MNNTIERFDLKAEKWELLYDIQQKSSNCFMNSILNLPSCCMAFDLNQTQILCFGG